LKIADEFFDDFSRKKSFQEGYKVIVFVIGEGFAEILKWDIIRIRFRGIVFIYGRCFRSVDRVKGGADVITTTVFAVTSSVLFG
jgi:hypothetical protein